MGELVSAYIFPHPPLIIPEVGKGEERGAASTVEAVLMAAAEIRKENPSTIIVTTPHGPVFEDLIYMSVKERLMGDFGRFGAPEVKLDYVNNLELLGRIISYAAREEITAGGLSDELMREYRVSGSLDHGALVPLYFVGKNQPDFKIIHISTAYMPLLDLYKFGMCIQKAVEDSGERVVLIASGDLSHKLKPEGPYGYHQSGPEFDKLLVESIKRQDIEGLMKLSEDFCEEAGECGLRSFIMMFGALDGMNLDTRVYSYEGPFGVGYSVARVGIEGRDEKREVYRQLREEQQGTLSALRSKEDPYIALARKTLETYVREGKVVEVAKEDVPDEMLRGRAGTFVSLKKNGQLRGCIGTIGPTTGNIADEIIQNAISAGTQDPRFSPVKEKELSELVYSVDVLREPEPITSMDALNVVRYGVIVRSGRKSGLLLPNLEGVKSPKDQVSIALQKAGIRPDETYTMERFEVIRHQ